MNIILIHGKNMARVATMTKITKNAEIRSGTVENNEYNWKNVSF